MQESKILKKHIDLLKDLVYVIALIGTLFGAYYKLQQSVQTTNIHIEQLTKDSNSLQSQLEKISTSANTNSTDIKVLQTQVEILRSKQ